MEQADFRMIPLGELRESALNPRKHFDPARLEELTTSVRTHGVRTPLLVRPNGKGYEIGAGHRRFRAAAAAGLAEVPAVVRAMPDPEFLELLTFENLQREDVHPLEEAEGYRQLLNSKGGYDAAKIAERVGKSVKYVYDRIKLLSLSKAAQAEFRDGRITAGHAILLARLTPKDQERVMDLDHGGLWQDQSLLFHPEQDEAFDEHDHFKPVSVRELQAWIDGHVRLEAAEADPMLFPELVQTVAAAKEESEKVVRITHEDMTPDDAKDGQKLYLGRSWKRADAAHGSKTCVLSVTGVVVIGPGRGEAFKVCVAKDKCRIHWAERIKELEARAKEAKAGPAAKKAAPAEKEPAWKREQRKYEEERKQRDAEFERWKRAAPALLTSIAAAVKKAPAGAKGKLADLLIGHALDRDDRRLKTAAEYLPRGTSPEDLVRHLAFVVLAGQAGDYYSPKEFPKLARTVLGIDVAKVVDQAAPREIRKDEGAPPAKKKGTKRGKSA